MLYAMFATDIPNGVQLRESLREQHVAFLQGAGDNVRAAGRTLDDDGGDPNGSFMIYQADSVAEVETFLKGDPFVVNGLYQDVVIRPWLWVLGDGKPVED